LPGRRPHVTQIGSRRIKFAVMHNTAASERCGRVSSSAGERGSSLKRRDFIAFAGAVAAGWPLAGRAQQPPMPVIGFVRITTPQDSAPFLSAFRRGLAESSYIEGQNVAIEARFAFNQVDRLPSLMAELVSMPVAVLVATGGTITTGDDPVKVGLVASLNKPAGNLTGVSIFTNRLGSKRFALLHEMVPFASPIAILINPTNSDTVDEAKDVQEAARSLGVQVFVVSAGNADDLDGAFARLEKQGARALFVAGDTFFTGQRSQISILAARNGLPTSWSSRIETEAGGLMSYGGSFLDVYRQAGVLAGKILKGANPADLPVQLPSTFELVINVRTAKTKLSGRTHITFSPCSG
jgi:putative tryptophan/tyrosine transport system substrate-binding protein